MILVPIASPYLSLYISLSHTVQVYVHGGERCGHDNVARHIHARAFFSFTTVRGLPALRCRPQRKLRLALCPPPPCPSLHHPFLLQPRIFSSRAAPARLSLSHLRAFLRPRLRSVYSSSRPPSFFSAPFSLITRLPLPLPADTPTPSSPSLSPTFPRSPPHQPL